MLARDINSNPTQYRTWVVPNQPDFDGLYYTGLKSGTNDFVDVTAYAINDDSVIADFNLPLPTNWVPDPGESIKDFPIIKLLPAQLDDSHFAIVDGYAYMFGGKLTNKIYRASTNNPTDWSDTGATLPGNLYGGSLAIVDGYIYLFGGSDGYDGYSYSYYDGYDGYFVYNGGPVDTIFSAPTTDPLNWTNHGSLLPKKLVYSSLGMYDGYLYLFGGKTISGATDSILTAATSNPLSWTDTGFTLPNPIYGSMLAQVDGYWLLYGGLSDPVSPSRLIWHSPVTNSTFWQFDGYLPYATAHGQIFTMGNDGYIIGPQVGAAATGFTPILQFHFTDPAAVLDTGHIVRGVISHSQLAMIYDRIWLFGGSGGRSIFACNQNLKYDFSNATVQAYGQITRVLLPATNNLVNPFEAVGFPYWRTDYSF